VGIIGATAGREISRRIVSERASQRAFFGVSALLFAASAAVIRETLNRSGLAAEYIDTVVMGNVIQAGTKMNPARQAAIGAGLPVHVPAMTVNRVCVSGAQAIASAALEILAGYASCAIAGGMENMDKAPYLMAGGR
jgi:acetyl-CoA C-acetyltransferase